MKQKALIIPIVLAANDRYVPFLGTTIASIISSSEKTHQYNIYIFHTSISKDNQAIISAMQTENVQVEFVDINSYTKNAKLYPMAYFTIEMYYRILIPEILHEYKKVIYLDSDLIVLHDVADLYKIDIGNNIVGAINDSFVESGKPIKNGKPDMTKYYVEDILKLNATDYFNSGVLLINTEEFLKYNLREQFFEFIKQNKHLVHPDQDMFNLFCYGKRYKIDENWNFQTGNPAYSAEYKLKRIKQLKIIHFTSSKKPWNSPDITFADKYFEIAKTTPFYEEIEKRVKKAKGATVPEEVNGNLNKVSNSLKTLGFKATMNLIKEKIAYKINYFFKKVNKYNQPTIPNKEIEMAKKRNYKH